MNDKQILEALETLAAAFPWDGVGLSIDRKPAGEVDFWAKIDADYKRGAEMEMATGATPMEAVNILIHRHAGKRDPEIMREKKLRELREQIEKLEAVIIGPPPYRPGTQIPQYVDLEAA